MNMKNTQSRPPQHSDSDLRAALGEYSDLIFSVGWWCWLWWGWGWGSWNLIRLNTQYYRIHPGEQGKACGYFPSFGLMKASLGSQFWQWALRIYAIKMTRPSRLREWLMLGRPGSVLCEIIQCKRQKKKWKFEDCFKNSIVADPHSQQLGFDHSHAVTWFVLLHHK